MESCDFTDIDEYEEASAVGNEGLVHEKISRKRSRHICADDLWKSPWGLMMRSEEMSNPFSKASMKFRLRFRIPFKVFNEYLVPKCVELNVFEMQRRGSIPIEFKLLVVLKILARGNNFDTIYELSMIPLSTCHKISSDFVVNFVPRFLPLYVSTPTGNEFKEVINTYKSMRFNGAIGSIGCN